MMLFRSYLSNQTTLRLRQREGLFYTLLESSKRQQIITTATKNKTKNKQTKTSRQEVNDVQSDVSSF